jgi:hypothetical protein
MPRREFSEATYDALAAGRKPDQRFVVRPSGPPVQEWQQSYFWEPPMRLTARQPPALVIEESEERRIEASQVGVDMTEAMIDYIDAGFPSRPGGDIAAVHSHRFPVHNALLLWERECRKRHARWADHRGRPVCADIAWAVIRDRTSLLWAADQAQVSFPRAESLLRLAGEFMARKQEAWWRDVEQIVSHDREACSMCRSAA